MIVSVTPIGDDSGSMTPGEVGVKVAEYLAGVGLVRGGRAPGRALELPSITGEGTVAYYADSTGIRPGRWLGARSGEVDPEVLVSLIAGVDPETGEALDSTPTSSRGRRRGAELTALRNGVDWYATREAAEVLGVKHTYLQRLARFAEVSLAEASAGEASPGEVPPPGDASPVEGAKDGEPEARGRDLAGARLATRSAMEAGLITRTAKGSWLFHRDAISAVAAARNTATSVLAYDLTFSVPKDVSVIWARGDDRVRAQILDAIDLATAAGVSYLERHAFRVRVRGDQELARDWVGAEYLHLTSRALDPQLHKHLLVLNSAKAKDGARRALDGRLLFLHAKPAGYLAAAELRHQLAARLGAEFGPVLRGIAPVQGVPGSVVSEFSTRSREIEEATKALGVASAAARQVAAYDTRSAKESGFDFDGVTGWWGEKMDTLGFTEEALARDVLGRVAGPRVLSPEQLEAAFRDLVRVSGITKNSVTASGTTANPVTGIDITANPITENAACFDRRSVVEALATFAGERLSGAAIDDLADLFLSSESVVRLESSRETSSRNVIRLDNGAAVVVPLGSTYTTRAMLALEERARARYDAGRSAGAGVVPGEVLDEVLADERFVHLSEEQRRFVTELTTSGQVVQAAVGRAGSGKTTALEAAVAAWRAGGYEVIGSAVGGTQAVLLGEEATGESRTVASLLSSYFDFDNTSLITDRTVLIVDEASLLSTRDAALLERAVAEHPGAVLRLVGDEQQHTSVAAGGFFRWLVEERTNEVPVLATVYRQRGQEMAQVRLALDEYRAGMITEALRRLERDGRITEASSRDEAYDLLTCAWYAEHAKRVADPGRKISSMTAEHHHERRELNRRARALLKADGTLQGPELVVDGVGFQKNDEVIARIGDHDLRGEDLRGEGAGRDRWVRNGSRGVVEEVADDHLVVSFERWGSVSVPRSYIAAEVVPGVRGGLMHAYALTTFAAQGATMAAAMPLVTDASSREGVYVAITRPQFDLNAVAIRYDRLRPSPVEDDLPAVRREASDLEATARALERDRRERLASQVDPLARRVHELATTTRLSALEDAVAQGGPDLHLYERALGERLRVVGLRAVVSPGDDVLEHLGPRPTAREERAAWDAAVGAIAIYREREEVTPDRDAGGVEWAIGPRPPSPERAEDYDRFAALIEPLDEAPDNRAEPSVPEGSTSVTGAGVEADADAPDRVEATPQTDSGSEFAALADKDLVAYASELRRAVARHERDLERRSRAIELRIAHLAERVESGADTTDLEADLTLARERAGQVEGDLQGLLARLAGVEQAAAGRGIDLEAVPLAAQVRRDAEPVLPPELSPAVVPGGPEIGI